MYIIAQPFIKVNQFFQQFKKKYIFSQNFRFFRRFLSKKRSLDFRARATTFVKLRKIRAARPVFN